MKNSWFSVSGQKLDDWTNLCQPDKFVLVPPSEMPEIIPRALIEKADSVLVMASGTTLGDGTTYFIANINRVDFKSSAIDQEPFALAFVGGQAEGSACIIHHGNWPGRTTEPGVDYWDQIRASGLGYCADFPELPRTVSGQLAELADTSHERAMQTCIYHVRRVLEEE